MPSKVQLYAQMADRTAEQITGLSLIHISEPTRH